MDLNEIRVDTKKVNEGIDVVWKGDIVLTIAKIQNKRYKDVWNRLIVEALISEQIMFDDNASDADKEKTNKALESITCEAIARTCFIGWKNIQIDGKEVEYSEDKAVELFNDESIEGLADFIAEEASKHDNFKLNLEVAKKKSVK